MFKSYKKYMQPLFKGRERNTTHHIYNAPDKMHGGRKILRVLGFAFNAPDNMIFLRFLLPFEYPKNS
jgi:hypothetical protein